MTARRSLAVPVAVLAAALALLVATSARAQAPGGHGDQPPQQPKGGQDDQGDRIQVTQRAEPTPGPPADPLAISPEMRARIGTDWDGTYASPEGAIERRFHWGYEETRGDYRLRLLPPFLLEQTRGLKTPTTYGPGGQEEPRVAIPTTEDTQGLYGMLYYRRRSLNLDEDVIFPAFWRVRDRYNHVFVAGPLMHREAPGEHDNWLAPLFFTGSRPDGGYFHLPLLLTTSHWGEKGAFTLAGPYFRDRTGTDVDAGVVPFYFHGDNGNIEGNRRTYTLIPPLLYYNRTSELEEASTTVVGPFVWKTNPKRDIFDVAPFFFHIRGKPESGGVKEEHWTLFPFFHYGYDPEQSLFIIPGYLRRVTKTSDTLLTPFVSHATTRNGATSFWAVGPGLPLFFTYSDKDVGENAFAIAPFYYQSDSPAGHDFLTPFFGKFETYGQSRSYYVFPSITVSRDTHGWSTNVYPLFFMGRNDDSAHTVIAPIFWDFASPKGRSTVAFPLFWRFADTTDGSVIQLAANTLYIEKRAPGGKDWQFHFLPLFSYGETPDGYWWNLLFGLAGYDREGSYARIKAFWIPIQVAGASGPPPPR